MLRHVGITVIKRQFEFHNFIDIIHIKFRDFNFHVSYISRVLNREI